MPIGRTVNQVIIVYTECKEVMVAMILFKFKLKCENQIKVNKSNPNIGLLLLDVLFLFFSFENPLETDTSRPDLIFDCSVNGVGLTVEYMELYGTI